MPFPMFSAMGEENLFFSSVQVYQVYISFQKNWNNRERSQHGPLTYIIHCNRCWVEQDKYLCALSIHFPLYYCCINLMLMYCTICAAKNSLSTFFPTAFLFSLNVHVHKMLHQVNIEIKQGTLKQKSSCCSFCMRGKHKMLRNFI